MAHLFPHGDDRSCGHAPRAAASCVALMLSVVCLLPAACCLAEDSPVADAAERGDAGAIERLLKSDADVDAAQADGMTALLWACHRGDAKLADRLLEAGADPDRANLYGVRPLSLAAREGSGPLIDTLLAAGADVTAPLPGDETPLMTAARTGDPDAVASLLRAGADVDARERSGQTALMWAAAEGHDAAVRLLLEAGARQEPPLKSGFTPLLFAARAGHAEVVDQLLRAGADVDAVMRPARSGGKLPRDGTGALMLAVENGHFELALKLIDAGADANDQRSGFTPLHAITWVRKPNRGDGPDGDPPPRPSGRLGSLEFVRQLVERGADVNAQLRRGGGGRGRIKMQGATPFLLACKTADVPLMRLLLELGADPTRGNADGCTPLMAAAGVGTIAPQEEAGTEPEAMAAVELLLEHGADIDAVDDNGETAMHGAAYKSFPQVVRLLAARGADIEVWNRKNQLGWTPLMIAEGHRVGNFKPSFETVEAIHEVMRAAGVTPPPPTPRQRVKGYQQPD